MAGSRTDRIYRSILLTKFFTKGWGKPESLKRLFQFRKVMSDREKCMQLVDRDHPVTITKRYQEYTLLEGQFQSPFSRHCPGLLPEVAEPAYFQAVLPNQWPTRLRPTVIHLAGTGDHFFWKRRSLLARPLLRDGIGSIILENPYYGLRKPAEQVRSCLRSVSDLFVMGGCLMLESMALLHWAERSGLGPLGITGISMGGHMASLAASVWHKPISLVPCLSWTSASAVFTSGVLSNAINWELLERQYVSDTVYRNELLKMIQEIGCASVSLPSAPRPSSAEGDHFHAGRQFARGFPDEMAEVTRVAEQMVADRGAEPRGRSLAQLALVSPLASLVRSKPKLVRPSAQASSSRPATMMEAYNFMRGIMDECTHLANFPVPVDPELALIVQARDDAYIPREGLTSLTELWPGSKVRFIDTGHIGAYLFNQDTFREAIVDTFEKMIKKYNLKDSSDYITMKTDVKQQQQQPAEDEKQRSRIAMKAGRVKQQQEPTEDEKQRPRDASQVGA
ncbi:protein ABHD18-like isoform X2 [Amphibalanus amphitrite]|uniref:protein ABHD18-like isoform X2 n=1 Tax=Amphibalanus amphitrite TaxID=1232801 RepID=UPI001C9030F4|nr:protein ABHD18-like isoform X2 [Amphibalanus amphitrite]